MTYPNDWTLAGNAGNDHTIQTGRVNEGNAALQANGPGLESVSVLDKSITDSPAEVQAIFDANIDTTNIGSLALVVRYQDINNFSAIVFSAASNGAFLKVHEVSNGNKNQVYSQTSISNTVANSWGTLRVSVWDDSGSTYIRVESGGAGNWTQDAEITQSLSFSGGGIGISNGKYNDGTNAWIDDLEVFYA
jgi:hypothetical protein